MTRQTSIEAYRRIQNEGLLPRMRFLTYEALYNRGPATAGELAPGLPMRHGVVSTRLSELVRHGVAYEVQTRACNETGYTAIEFDVTDKLPVPLVKEVKATRKELEADNERLRSDNAQLASQVKRLKARVLELKKQVQTPKKRKRRASVPGQESLF